MDQRKKVEELTKEELIQTAKRQNKQILQLQAQAKDSAGDGPLQQKCLEYEQQIEALQAQLLSAAEAVSSQPTQHGAQEVCRARGGWEGRVFTRGGGGGGMEPPKTGVGGFRKGLN